VPSGPGDPMRYLVGLIGTGIGTSLSPQLHEREADEQGLRYFYQLIDIGLLGLGAADVGYLLAEARRMGFRGLNITHPCKQAAVKHLDELSPTAAQLGSVNTVVFTESGSVGHNTDMPGFAEAFARELSAVRMRHVVVLGVGGAGVAVARAALILGVERLTIVDAVAARARELSIALRATYAGRVHYAEPADLPDVMVHADGLIQATPVGMEPQYGMPVAPHLLRPEMWVADIVYRPLETELLREARSRGCRTMSGLGMLVFQAAGAFRLFTGREADTGRMLRHAAALTSASARSAAPTTTDADHVGQGSCS
jgi:shikimate dehydrogenase